ncbi:MAG: helix-turn-helix transcriptional regulator, partial [Mycobacterium sp.]|nr:helix-turn-helix transcriptional regulator [Mycobacterium sp.]
EAEAAHDGLNKLLSLGNLSSALAYQGEVSAARAAADAVVEAAPEHGDFLAGMGYSALTLAALAAGEVETAQEANEAAWRHLGVLPKLAALWPAFYAQVALAGGDLTAARRWADDAVSAATGWHLMAALTTRARVAIAQREFEQAECDAREALACAAGTGAPLFTPDIFECLAGLAGENGSHREAARLFGAADAIRRRMGAARFKIYDAGYEASVAALRKGMGDNDFDRAWAEGAALSTEEAISCAQRGHGERKRPATGWASLTPAEHDIVRLVGQGLGNKDIAMRLVVSPRTVQAHLTHVYTKLGLTSRVQLVQEAARHT